MKIPFQHSLEKHTTFGPPYAVLNLSRLGLRYFRIGLKVSKASQKKLVDHFINHPNVGWIFAADGWFNLAVGLWAKDNAEINDISAQIRGILDKGDKVVFQSELTSLYGFGNRPVTKNEKVFCIVDGTIQPIELSPLEIDYIKLVALDSSVSPENLAQILNASRDVVQAIAERMQTQRVIEGFQERIWFDEYYLKVFLNSGSAKGSGSTETLTHALWTDPACIYFARANSKYDIEFEIILKEKSTLKQYLKNFSDYKVVTLKKNLYTNLFPLNKVANLQNIQQTLSKQEGKDIDLRNSKLWYLNYAGAEAYLNIYENRKYAETMEKSEIDLFKDASNYIKKSEKDVFSIIDIGSGNGIKGRIFIERIGEQLVKTYYPTDIQPLELAAALKAHEQGKYAKFPTLLDIENLGSRFPLKATPGEEQIYIFFGGTYGNFPGEQINSYLKPLVSHFSSTLLIAMPIIDNGKTDEKIVESYSNHIVETMMFGPLIQTGFKKEDFEINPQHPHLILQPKMENRRLVNTFTLKNNVKILGKTFSKGTIFRVSTSWKPTLQEFQLTLEKDFVVEKIFHNQDMAIALIKKPL